jgi:hypothetical protein
VQPRSGEVDVAELARRGLAEHDRAACVPEARDHRRRARSAAIGEGHGRLAVGPARDLFEFLDPDRHAAEGAARVGRRGSVPGRVEIEMAERVQPALLDGGDGRLDLLGRRPLAAAERLD